MPHNRVPPIRMLRTRLCTSLARSVVRNSLHRQYRTDTIAGNVSHHRDLAIKHLDAVTWSYLHLSRVSINRALSVYIRQQYRLNGTTQYCVHLHTGSALLALDPIIVMYMSTVNRGSVIMMTTKNRRHNLSALLIVKILIMRIGRVC